MECYWKGDALNDSRIYAVVRKVDGPRVIVKIGRQRALSLMLVENAKAVMLKKVEVRL